MKMRLSEFIKKGKTTFSDKLYWKVWAEYVQYLGEEE